jgi:Tol biopolymer transport system component
MTKLVRQISFLIVFFLSGCVGGKGSPAPTNPADLPGHSPLAIVTPTITATRVVPSPTPSLTPTPEPDVVWTSGLKYIVSERMEYRYLNDLSWSPSANEFVYLLCQSDQLKIILAKEPDFTPHTLASINSCSNELFLPGVTWNPDGSYILFWGPTDKQPNDVWRMRRDGSDLHSLNVKDLLLSPLFSSWLDDQTLLYLNYSGGGHVMVTALNIQSGEINQIATTHGDIIGTPKNGYIPVSYSIAFDNYHLFLLSQKFPKRGQEAGSFLMMGRFIPLPAFDNSPIGETMTSFQGWQPDTNKILVSWSKYSSYPGGQIQKQNLLLWDVPTGSLSIIATNGFHGEYSSDGHYLAYSSFDPKKLLNGGASFYDNGSGISMNITDPNLEPPFLQEQIYLQLLDMSDHKIILSLPGRSNTFSTDGHYLSFISKGQVKTDDHNWPVAIDEGTEQKQFLHLVDLQTKQLIASLPDVESSLGWSPDNHQFLYQDNSGNIFLYQIEAHNSIPFSTRLVDSDIEQTRWSYDGSYVIFELRKPDSTEDEPVTIVQVH